jgi:hypothetical protein
MPISNEAKKRIHSALAEALMKELTHAQQAFDVPSVRPPVHGPWSMLIDAGDTWTFRVCLSRELYGQLRGSFSDDIVREVLLAAAGVKVSRTFLSDAKLTLLRAIAHQHGFSTLASTDRYIYCRDAGKGGFCNAIEHVAKANENSGLRIVYIASEPSLTEAAKLIEEAADDQLFGILLGIPPCCRGAYARFQPMAIAKQFDLIPMVLDNTAGEIPYDPWVNYPAIYFGRALLSFFPCSFRCPAARAVARSTYSMLARCDRPWARSFLSLQRTNILYTEYQGLHLFRRPLVDGWITYGPGDVDSTEPTDVAALIRCGNRLQVRGRHQLGIYCEATQIGVLEGEDISMCAFC